MEPYIDEFGNLQFKQPDNYTGINGINMGQLNVEPYESIEEMRGQPENRSVLDQGIPFALPNLNYRNYDLSNLFNTTEPDLNNFALARRLMTQPGLDTFTGINKGVYDPYGIKVEDGRFSYDMNKTSLADYQPMAMRKDLGMDTSYGLANEPDVEQVAQIQGPEKRGLGALLELVLPYLPFGEKSLTGYLADKILPKESPEMKAAKSFYRDQYGLDPVGRVASGIMAGYNPVSGGLLNMITGGKYGKPPTIGLQRAYQKNIDLIQKNLDRGIYRDPQAKMNKLNQLIKEKRAEQMAIERPTIDRAKAAAPDVYSRAEANKALGPGGGFSTSGSKPGTSLGSGQFKSSSNPRGRKDY